MTNKNIIKELEENKKGHVIFESQDSNDLEELRERLQENNQIVVDFPLSEWQEVEPTIDRENDCFKIRITRQYIASKILSELSNFYPQLDEYRGKDSVEKLKQPDIYEGVQDLIYNLYDVRDILDIEEIPIDRIHFIINGIKSDILCDSISLLLREDNAYNTSIYSTNDFTTEEVPDFYDGTKLWEAYKYTLYHKNEEGKTTNPIKQTRYRI